MLVFHVEPLHVCWNEAMELAMQHWCETEAYRHGQGFNPKYERYEYFARMGLFFVVTARDEGRMVGYFSAYVTPSMHTQQMLGTEDTFFLLPEYRKGRNAIAFYKVIEEEFIKRGVVEAGMTAKLSNPAACKILKYLGYQEVSMQYSKHLAAEFTRTPEKEMV